MYMHHTPKELVLSVHALYPHRIGVPYHCMHVAKNITVFTTALSHGSIKKCVWWGGGGGGLISFEQNDAFAQYIHMHQGV